MSMTDQKPKVYDDGRTKQSFKDQTDINKILAKASRTRAISHLDKWGGQYGDFTGFDMMEAQNNLAKAHRIFDELPGEIKREFQQNPSEFFKFASDPANAGRLTQLMPELAQPGDQLPTIVRTAATEAPTEPTTTGPTPTPEPTPPVTPSET